MVAAVITIFPTLAYCCVTFNLESELFMAETYLFIIL